MGESNCIQNAVFYSVVLNLVLPFILKPFATPEEIKLLDKNKRKMVEVDIKHCVTLRKSVSF